MENPINQFLTKHVDIFEMILKNMWKTQIMIKEKFIHPENNTFIVDFFIGKNEFIRLTILVDQKPKENIETLGISYHLYRENIKKSKQYLAFSFLYNCPYDLELCNQFGLYTKEDAEKIEKAKNEEEVKKYKDELNLLKDNQFYIINMNRIDDHCSDSSLDAILQEIHLMIQEWNHASFK